MVHPRTLSDQDRPREWSSRSEQDTIEIGRSLVADLTPDGTLLLEGDLGAGKTVLARGVAIGLGIAEREIQSPTFTLIREHQGSEGRLVHVDLYRLDPSQVDDLGLEEILLGSGVKVVEWSERISFPLPKAIRLQMLVIDGGRTRSIREVAARQDLS